MEYPEFETYDNAVWLQKSITELKEKSFEKTLKWVVSQNVLIDAYADSYLASDTELSAMQQMQQKSTKYTFVESQVDISKNTNKNIEPRADLAGEENVIASLLHYLLDFNEWQRIEEQSSTTNSVEFSLSLDADYLLTIAKLRALRFLANRLSAMYSNSSKIIFRGKTNENQYETANEHINIVRATTMTMAGIVGGCDLLEITPFDRKTNEFSGRVAKNVWNILNEEAYFSEVADPAAGSFFLENLTYTLIQETWKQFVEKTTAL